MQILQDLRFAVRGLRRAPGLVVVATVSLGVGIAAVTTMWTATDTLMFRPLPYDPADELVFVGTVQEGRGGPSSPSTVADFLDLRDAATTVRLAAYRNLGVSLGGEPPEWVSARRVSGDFFDVLGIAAHRGRLFTRADERADAAETAVLGHGLWQRRFGGDPSIVGRTLSVDGRAVTVVGVLPPGFEFGFHSPDLWLPMKLAGDGGDAAEAGAPSRTSRSVSVIGRTAGGSGAAGGLSAARAELATLAAGLAEAYPATNAARTFRANGVRDEWFGGATFRQGAITSLVAAVLVLLVACVNVTNLLLARGAGRFGEITIRRALGAGRLRLVRQLLTEAVILAAAGGVLGILLSIAGVRGLLELVPSGMPRTGELGIDGRALAIGMTVALGSALLFGLVPSLRTVRGAPGRVDGARSDGMTSGRSRLRGVLVGAEIALAMVLLATTSLVIRSATLVQGVDTGFRTDGIVTFTVDLPASRYADDAALRLAARRIDDAVAGRPGVVESGVGVGVPARHWRSVAYRLPEEIGDDGRSVFARFATPGYLATLGLDPVRGRALSPRDDAGAPRVALVNERFATTRWGADADPVGRVLHVGEHAVEVVGVVPDAHEYGPTFPPQPALYLPLAQWPASRLDVVLAGAPAATLLEAGRRAVAEVDPALAVHDQAMLARVLLGPAEQFTALAKLLAVLAAAAILLAVAGVYGSMSYAVARRVPEIGLRMAVGADAGAVRTMVLRDAARVALVGLAIGLVLALGAARGVSAFLFGVGPGDPVAFLGVPALLLAVSLAAAWVPARRASRVDPMVALRE